MPDYPTILVTGASGFVGRHVCKVLREGGHRVYGTSRHTQGASRTTNDYELIKFDLMRQETFELPTDVDVVVHCAAVTSENIHTKKYSLEANVLGTKRLLTTCASAGVKRFIYISSMSAAPENPSVYSRTKQGAEQAVKESGLDYVIIRPGLILGIGSAGIFQKMLNLIDKFPLIPIIGDNSYLSTIQVQDLCEVISKAIVSPMVTNATVEACAAESLSLKEIVLTIAEVRHLQRMTLGVPYWVALPIARLCAWLGLPLITTDNVYGLKHARRPRLQTLHDLLNVLPSTFSEFCHRVLKER